VKGRRAVLATGVAVAALYLAMATLAGRTGPLARLPLLDGFGGTPPPYNWVSPPPSLASQNKQPAKGKFDVALNPQTGSEATVLSTDDGQASLALNEGSIPPRDGQGSATITITPLAPSTAGKPPAGLEITGNVYRIEGTYQPSGDPITKLAQGAQIVLSYPAEAGGTLRKHELQVSADGQRWTAVEVVDSHAQLLVQATVSTLGFFAVARVAGAAGAAAGTGSRLGSILVYVLLGLLIVSIAFFIIRTERRMRRERREIVHGRSGGKGRVAGKRGDRKGHRSSRRDPFRE
jgi:hypothetical protein